MDSHLVAKVKGFVIRLLRDRTFRSGLEQTDATERTQYLAEQGYSFSREEFESAAVELLDASDRGEMTDISEDELAAVFGGYVGKAPIIQPMYGVIWWPFPIRPIHPPVQPLYGVVIDR